MIERERERERDREERQEREESIERRDREREGEKEIYIYIDIKGVNKKKLNIFQARITQLFKLLSWFASLFNCNKICNPKWY